MILKIIILVVFITLKQQLINIFFHQMSFLSVLVSLDGRNASFYVAVSETSFLWRLFSRSSVYSTAFVETNLNQSFKALKL